ncbi:glycine zipper 2TM domain-containing protein [Roseateles cellulosilyticus]|uniref:glycine zipper 2TM domain-containing protein n=1 Tax=Pelomonas cellulosilytica TaxID=2906762 RepID=UPI00272A29DB|nr:glycine zipper 2TM domain-containing protein [Pelomonas sp. P8]
MSTPNVKSTQIVAGVAVVLALLGGAYAVGRSQGFSSTPPAEQAAAAEPGMTTSPSPAPLRQQATPERVAAAESPREVQRTPAEPPAQPALCESCGRVTDVHTETRHGKASGVGAVGGAVVGGLLGNMVGGGNGRKLATVGGAVAGGYAGNEIEKNQKSYTVWVVQVRERDGRLRRFERSNDPGVQVGDEVRLTENGFSRP